MPNNGGLSMRTIGFVFLFLLTLLPNYSNCINVHQPASTNQRDIFYSALYSRNSANEHLMKADMFIDQLTDFKDICSREKLKTLVAATINTIIIPEPRTKFLSVALTLLGDVVINEGFDKAKILYKIYLELSYAASDLEEFKYFSRLYLEGIKPRYWEDKLYTFSNFAIEELTIADMLISSLKCQTVAYALSQHLTAMRQNLMDDMVTNGYLNSSKIHNYYLIEIRTILENFNEITSECSANDRFFLKDEIEKRITDSIYYLERAGSD